MEEITYVYDGNIEKLSIKVEKLNRKATKLGVPAIQLLIGEAETVYSCEGRIGIEKDPRAFGDGAAIKQHTRAQVALFGDPPKLAGWTFVAVVDHLSNGIITRYPHAEKTIDLTPYRGADATCDHCQWNRKRNETFIVVHEDGAEKRVGRNCLADFLGHGNPSSLIGHLNLWGKAFEAIEGAGAAGIGSGEPALDIFRFVGFVVASIRERGWVSRGKAWDTGTRATADDAQGTYWHFSSMQPKEAQKVSPTLEEETEARDAVLWARNLTDAIVGDSDYLFNLRAVCQDDFIRPKRGGLAGSVVVAYRKSQKSAQNAGNTQPRSNLHVGVKGERLKALEVTLLSKQSVNSCYGVSILHKFEDSAGNLLIWFASNPDIVPAPEFGYGEKRAINEGETLAIAGTVKAHEDYRGRKQTKLTRVAVPKKKSS